MPVPLQPAPQAVPLLIADLSAKVRHERLHGNDSTAFPTNSIGDCKLDNGT